ncbi:hypothetical protein RhiirA5_376272, partial [Rhizophagus irregularis]
MSEAEKTSLGKRNYLRSELFTRELFKENDLPSQHKNAKTHREVKCLNCPNKTWLRKIGDSNTSNLWRHLERNHPDKNPKKAKNLIIESQSTLDEFVGHTTFPSK